MKNFFWLLCLLPLLLFPQKTRKYPSLLWKITGKDARKPSYLYGTMHVSNRVAYYLSEQFFDALKSVDVVGLETNPGEWLENMQNTGELAELTDVHEPSFNRNFYKSAFAVSFPEKRIFQSILSYDPDIINGLLYRQNKSRENFEESTYIDLFIYQTAAKLNKPVISLEDFVASQIKAKLSAIPDDDGEATRNDYRNYGNAQKLEDAYREGNLDLIDSLSRLSGSANMQKYLINDRNVFFVNTIDSVLQKNTTLFSGVGAAHLPGENGVIELLRKKGYTVEPVFSEVTKKSNLFREEIDQKVKPVTFSKQIFGDSLFSADAPGKFYKIFNAGQLKYYIHADMANGSFYTIVRLRHMGQLFSLNARQVFAKVDSLLFENIPGRITRKNIAEDTNGFPVIEVVNRTRNGDEQHYKIYFTDNEMILFKLGGKRDYASSETAEKFFSSIHFNKRDSSAVRFSPPTGGFTVSIPGNYTYERTTYTGLTGQVEDVFAFSNNQVYGVRHAVYNDFNYLEEDSFELNQLASNVLDLYKYNSSTNTSLFLDGKFPAVHFKGKNQSENWLHGRIFIKGVHYYLVYCVTRDSNLVSGEFFSSFTLGDFVHINPIKEITDKELGFKALDEVTEDAGTRFGELFNQAYETTLKKTDTVKALKEHETNSKMYYSPSSNEYIAINYERFSPYDDRSPETIAEKMENAFKTNTSMFLGRKSSKSGEYGEEFRFTLCDTATVRALEVRIIFCNRAMYELTAPFDTTIGLKGWTAKFFNSFTPVDSVSPETMLTAGFGQFAADLTSNDTVKRQRARSD